MDKILVILPVSIGGRLTVSSIKDGFIQNKYIVDIYDELYKNKLDFDYKNYKFIVGYDFSPVKFKIDNNLNIPTIAYFSDVIQEKTSGVGYLDYYKYLTNDDIFVFYWDRELSKKEKVFYFPHFVNCEIYRELKLLSETSFDISFMGRLDTKIRLETYLNLNKYFKNLKFSWHAIKRHYLDALSRCSNDFEKTILKNTYKGFIDNEKDMAKAINETKIVYNINSQGISSLNYRTFQVLACKRLLISDKREELDLFNGIVPCYYDFDDLVKKIEFYLNYPNEYKKITQKSNKIIQLNHDSKICVKEMIKMINSKIN